MKWRVLVSAPYMLPELDKFRPRLEAEGVDIVTTRVNERLSEEELLPLVRTIDGAICGDDRFTERVLRKAPRLKVISKWGTGIDSIDAGAASKLGIRVYNTPDAFTDDERDDDPASDNQRPQRPRNLCRVVPDAKQNEREDDGRRAGGE